MLFQRGHVNSPEVRLKISLANRGKIRSEEQRANYRRAFSKRFKGADNGRWKGGRKKSPLGYILIWNPSHPYVMKGGYVLEHRLIMEKQLGRYLNPNEEVHHINGIRDDNRGENLRLFPSRAAHVSFERKMRAGIWPGPLIQEWPAPGAKGTNG